MNLQLLVLVCAVCTAVSLDRFGTRVGLVNRDVEAENAVEVKAAVAVGTVVIADSVDALGSLSTAPDFFRSLTKKCSKLK